MSNPLQTLSDRFRSLIAPTTGIDPADLADSDPTVRWRAARALAMQPQGDLLPQTLQLLTDTDPTIRFEAVRALSSWGPGYDELQPAVDLLASDPSSETTITILDLFSELPLPAAYTLVQDRLKHDDPHVRAAAAHALGTYDEPEDIARLAPLANDPIPDVRRAACMALGEIDDPTVQRLLRQHLQDPDPITRQIAQRAIDRRQDVKRKVANPQPKKFVNTDR